MGNILALAPVSSFRVILPCGVDRVDSHTDGFVRNWIHCQMGVSLSLQV